MIGISMLLEKWTISNFRQNSEANGIVENGMPITVGHTYKNGKKAAKWVVGKLKILHTTRRGWLWI